MRRLVGALLVGAAALVGGCTSMDYLLHSASGHLSLMVARRPLDAVVADPATPPDVAQRLSRVREMRRFAAEELALPARGSYRHYVGVGRDHVVYSVVAAPALSLEPRRWCYPVVGCLSYRGFFDVARAAGEAQRLRAKGLDVYVAPVQAYSTLGWFDDPVLDTLLRGPEWSTASVIFHELAHQRLYLSGDTAFNEAYATAVQEEGERRWLARHGDGDARANHARYQRAQAGFLALVRPARERLRAIYASDRSEADKLAAKAATFAELRARFVDRRHAWGGYRGFDRWFAQDLNNAKLALVSTYNELVPRFNALLGRLGGDMEAFHREVARIGALDRDARRAALPGG